MKPLPLLLLALLAAPLGGIVPASAQNYCIDRTEPVTCGLAPPPAQTADRLESYPPYPGLPPPPPSGVLLVDEAGRPLHRQADGLGGAAWEVSGNASQPIRHDAATQGTLVVFRDDVRDDGYFGGFGEWTVYGDSDWWVRPEAAHSGDLGIQLAEADGTYPAQQSSMLLSPELDLTTGMPERAVGAAYSGSGAAGAGNVLLDLLWRTAVGGADTVAATVNSLGLPLPVPRASDLLRNRNIDPDGSPATLNESFTPQMPEGTYTYRFSFDLRTNLQDGVDGMQVWGFDRKPASMPTACLKEDGCLVLQPDVGYDEPTRTFPDGAFTGAHPWTRVSVEILPYAQRSAWIALAFRSSSCPVGCFDVPGAFDPDAGFHGAQMDAFQAQVEAAPHSVRLRPLAEPSLVPEGRDNVTMAPGQPIPVLAEIANLGQSDESIDLTVELRDGTGALVQFLGPHHIELAAGHTKPFPDKLAPLPPGHYTLHAALGGLSPDDVNETDDHADLAFDVERIESIRLLGIAASALQVHSSDQLEYVAVVANRGNVAVNATVTPHLYDVTDNVTLGRPATLADARLDNRTPQALRLVPGSGAGSQAALHWGVTTTAPGQVQLEVALQAPIVIGDAVQRGPAVGIDRTPPPLFYQDDARDAPRGGLLRGDWSAAGLTVGDEAWHGYLDRDPAGSDYWLDPSVVHYLGRDASATCEGTITGLEGCRPFATVRDPAPANARPGEATLLTPAIFIDPGAPDPTFVFEHQLATNAIMFGCNPFDTDRSCSGAAELFIQGSAFLRGRVGSMNDAGVIEWDQWEDGSEWLQLRSRTTPVMRGTDGERAAGIYDPERGPRGYSASDSGGAPTTFCAGSAPCQWWWPSGRSLTFQGPGDAYPTQYDFGSGSPWLVEEVPLANTEHGTSPQSFDARGRYFQAEFSYALGGTSEGQRTMVGPTSEGWRIGAVSVLPTPDLQSDLAVTALEPLTSYDPEAIGLGPDTTVKFQATVANRGALDASGVEVALEALDGAGELRGGGSTILAELKAGRTANVTIAWDVPVPADGENLTLRLRASAGGSAGLAEDFPADNVRWSDAAYRVHAHRDLAAIADVLPRSGGLDALRVLGVAVENRGNVRIEPEGDSVPLVTRGLERLTGVGQPKSLGTETWRVLRAIAPGERVDLSDPTLEVQDLEGKTPDLSSELLFQPRVSGSYRQVVRVALAGGADGNASNDLVTVPFTVAATLYNDRFDKPAQRDPLVVKGLPALNGTPVWQPAAGGAKGSALRLAAGDPERGEMPAGTDGSYVLPPLDLTSVKRATLTFAHRFDLEAGFDAARVEISLDGGETWEPLQPRADPGHGLPLGYSTAPLLADLPISDGRVAPAGAGYTGNSALLPPTGLGDGWQAAEVPLGDYPGLRRDVTIDTFPLAGLESKATSVQPGLAKVRVGAGDLEGAPPLQFTDPSWALPEEGAVAAERYWWIDNQTYKNPMPRTASMWWSGSQWDKRETIDVFLNYTAPAAGTLTWWEWRSGWRDGDRLESSLSLDRKPGDPMKREGTGGAFRIEAGGIDRAPQAAQLEALDNGWTRRSLVLGAPGPLSFHYVGNMPTKTNRGWFLDDVRLDGAPLSPVAAGHRSEGEDSLYGLPFQDVDWTCIGTGSGLGQPCREPQAAYARPGGWHVEDGRPQPDGTLGASWRFSQEGGGYPTVANARLVTPVVDLGRVAGDNAWLTFDHRYDFESYPTECCAPNRPLDGRDGGVIEVQALNETTGLFEPWRVLVAAPPTGFAGIHLEADAGRPEHGWWMRGATGDHFRAMGYPAMQDPLQGSDLPRMQDEQVRAEADQGFPFPMPFTPVFSGKQDAWAQARFDVASLIGQKVRFAFHAATDGQSPGGAARLGWEVANVAVVGTAFEGREALLRLRVATDESRLKGEWSVDNLQLSGDLYHLHLAVRPDASEMRVQPSSFVDLGGNVTNLGVDERRRLALRVSVQGDDGPIGFTLDPVMHGIDEGVPAGADGLVGPFDLVGGASLPFRVRFRAPDGGDVRVDIRVYEDRGPDEFLPGQAPRHTPRFMDPLDEVPGSGMATVRVAASALRQLRFEPPTEGGVAPLTATPFVGHTGQPVTLKVGVRNLGTQAEPVTVRWSVVDRRLEDTPANRDLDQADTVTLAPGESRVVTRQWTPSGPGLYRATARINGIPNDGPVHAEVPVDRSLQVFTADFGNGDNWTRTGGFSPNNPNNAWTLTGTAARWGVDESHFSTQNNYCRDANNFYCEGDGNGNGMSAALATQGAPIDLVAPAGDQARLVLTHVWSFASGDGGVVEAAAFSGPDGSDPVCSDGGGPAWLRLTPEGGYPSRTFSDPGNANPVGGGPAFAGHSEGSVPTTSVFDLAHQALPGGCPELGGDGLLGHYVAIRLVAGTRLHPGGGGDRGWLVLSAGVGSSDLRLGPRAPPDVQGFERVLPVLDGMPKRFLALVTNAGPVGDLATLELAPDGSAPASWFGLPEEPAVLEPGQSRAVPFRVAVPAEDQAARTVYAAPMLVRSGNAPAITDRLLTGIRLQENLLPDLSVRLRLDGASSDADGVEAGTPVTVTAIVTNLGRLPSQPVKLLFYATPVGGARQALGEATIPALEPATAGRQGSFVAIGQEWITPERPGLVDLRAEADPAGLVVEQDRANNNFTLRAEVVGSDAPDLAITRLEVRGLSGDGFAEAGSFVTINATVSNLGRTSAPDVRVQVLLGSGVVAEEVIRQLLPGQNVTLSTLKAAPAGDFILRAFALSGAAKPDPNPDNDQATRMLRVRGHRLAVDLAGAPPAVAPGGRADLALRIENLANAPDRLRLEMAGNGTGWAFEAFPNPVIALPGTQTRVFVLLHAPAGAAAGEHTLPMRAVPLSAPALALPFNVTVQVAQVRPEVRLEGAHGAVVGRDATVDVTVRNLGNTARTLKVAVLGDEHAVEVSLAAFEARQVRLAHQLFAAPQDGNATLPLAAFDSTGTLATLQLPLEVHAVPIVGAEWSGLEAAPDGMGRSRLRFTLELANRGNEAVRVRPTVWGVEATVEPAAIDLPVGGTAQATLLVQVPDPLPERLTGTVRLVRDDNPSVSVAELDLPALPPQPNLRMEGWSVGPDAPRAGVKVPFRFELRNTGGAPSEPTLALVYVDRTLHATLPVPPLAPGEAVGLSGSIKLPEGEHAVIVLANAQRGVAELRTDDNGASAVLQVAGSTWMQRQSPGPDPLAFLLALAALAALAGRRRR